MINNIESPNEITLREEGETLDVKKIINLMLRQWYWFALFGAIGLAGAFVYNKIIPPKFSVNSTILIPEKSNGIDFKSMFEGAFRPTKDNIYNQIEIIKSYGNISQTLLDLNWRTSWFKKDFLIWKGIYKQEPFEIQEASNFVNPSGVKIYITPMSGNSYFVNIKGHIYENGSPKDIDLEANGQYGKPFVKDEFNFTLLKKANSAGPTDGEYYFEFNDLNELTLAYMNRLNTDLMDKKSDIILCSIEGEQPEKEGEFLNELVRIYIQNKMNKQSEAQRRSLDFINRQLAGISDSLVQAGNSFTQFKAQNNIVNLSQEGTIVMNSQKEIESERNQVQMQLDYFQNLLKYLDANTDTKQQPVSPSVVGIQDASLNSLVLKLSDLYNTRQILSFSVKENNPKLVLIDKQINQIRDQLTENVKNLIDNSNVSIKILDEREAKINAQLNRLPKKEQQMVNVERKFTLTNELYTFLLQKRAETNITLASTLPDVQIIDIARPETASYIGLSPTKRLAVGFLLGTILPLAYILMLNYFNDSIRTQEDVENYTAIPVLGSIIHNPDKSDLSVWLTPKSTVAESFRTLRTNLHFMLNAPNGKVISVHSSIPGTGKSFVATNLATILAMNNNKVLLIGADLRKPRLHKIFNLENGNGLSTILIGYSTIDQVIIPSLVENLSLLPSGPIPPNPSEILGNPKMEKLISDVRMMFDYIVIDNAPIGLVTDGFIVSHLSDLNIFLLRYGFSHKHEIEILNQYASKKMITNPAIVVNDIKFNVFGYTYYKYYKYEDYQNTYYATDEKKEKTHRQKKLKAS